MYCDTQTMIADNLQTIKLVTPKRESNGQFLARGLLVGFQNLS